MSDFKWAHGQNANIKEPLSGLKESGWQYGDVPTSSNFNWLFNELQKALEGSQQEFENLNNTDKKLTDDLRMLADTTEAIKIKATRALEKSISNERKVEFSIGISRQICMFLRIMEANINKYHRDFPSQPWPLNDVAPRRINEEPEIRTESENMIED